MKRHKKTAHHMLYAHSERLTHFFILHACVQAAIFHGGNAAPGQVPAIEARILLRSLVRLYMAYSAMAE